ncbi:MAG TPA: hypothetical protein DEB30_05115 [Candidatus Peribacter riflensis]|uniref:Uncharacterized protein n=1 Tax=Candidatus Peribacter riflensis TaxID=1735162 RepID=A0A0S1SVB1_9BACT|nr:MAG: hypothetical protein PeribacterA2_0254 [Candidatus Peribacter riflensis]OGJ78226.1 MAG: hypothetical protein A2398_05025 [Candidatus Peribacteria bacterium RIFOXYB1_FULL_57_12]OGJ83074.1 MAG: hypothetical protein A2412_01075 [Candidatus Peribacteria bacterium RIFOXYC1_FULL_58_8]ALM10748.1 MAG: hypothetical protein PeribacterB2_0254 [Candidatus Peribacter riflensis]ALM11850.1 MAG: hypothetical protein PeribacterC2_0253 [Candidatus Peribacter riflensis]
MNHQTFSQELEKLTALPEEQVARAKEASQGLNEADRAEFLKQLTASDQELAGVLQQQNDAAEAFAVALTDAEKQMNRVERSSVESAEKREEIKEAEQGISDLPAAA